MRNVRWSRSELAPRRIARRRVRRAFEFTWLTRPGSARPSRTGPRQASLGGFVFKFAGAISPRVAAEQSMELGEGNSRRCSGLTRAACLYPPRARVPTPRGEGATSDEGRNEISRRLPVGQEAASWPVSQPASQPASERVSELASSPDSPNCCCCRRQNLTPSSEQAASVLAPADGGDEEKSAAALSDAVSLTWGALEREAAACWSVSACLGAKLAAANCNTVGTSARNVSTVQSNATATRSSPREREREGGRGRGTSLTARQETTLSGRRHGATWSLD